MKAWSGVLARLGVAMGLAAAAALAGAVEPGEVIGQPVVVAPKGNPAGAVVLFSGAGGWGDAERATAAGLTEAGYLVLGIDVAATARRMDKRRESCVTLIGEIEEASHQAQREAGGRTYHFPVLAGMGAGGALVLAVAGQTEAATIARVVAVDPEPALPARKPLCDTAGRRQPAAYALPAAPLAFPLLLAGSAQASPAVREQLTRLGAGRSDIVQAGGASPVAALLEGVKQGARPATDALADLPLVELPVQGASDIFAILYSGDGGWRDLDKDVAAILQREGMPVVGVDVLRYFWHRQPPEQAARDLARIITTYGDKWHARQVVLIGYSFGADVLPALYNRLPADARARVLQLSLLGLADDADFEVTVSGWLGSSQADALPTLPELARIEPRKVQCVYGVDDEDTACAKLTRSGAEVIRTKGAHHFDGDYEALARRIVQGARKRAAP